MTLTRCPHLLRPAALLAGLALLGALPLAAGEPNAEKQAEAAPLPAQPPVLSKAAAPAGVEDLRAMERHVQKVLARVVPATVAVRVGPGQGSGVIIDKEGHILTAGHVSGQPGKDAIVILPDGKQLKARTLGRNNAIDSGMMKIVEPGTYPHVEMGKASDLKKGQWVIAVGHPGGFRTNRTPVVRVGRVLYANPFLIRTDCTLVGGDSGGPLFDMTGKVIGIHSRIGPMALTENIHVPIDTYRETRERLARGESFGGPLGRQEVVQSAGGKVVFEKQDRITADDPFDKKLAKSHHKVYTFPARAGSTYTFDLLSRAKNVETFDPFLRLEDAAGKQLAENDDGGGDLNSRIVYRAVRDADVHVVVTTFEPDQTGPFRLTVREADVKETFVKGSVDVLRTLKLPKQVAGSITEKFAKGGVPLYVTASLLDAEGNPATGKEAVFKWADGKEVLKANDQGVVRWRLSKDRLKKLVLDLPAGTRALVALTDARGNPSGLRFNAENDPTIEKVKSAGGKVVLRKEGELVDTDPTDREKTESYHHVHEFKLKAGRTYTFDLESDDFDPFLRLEDENRRTLAEDDDGAGYLNSRIVRRATADETVRIVTTSYDGGYTGPYVLTVRERATDAPGTTEKQTDPNRDPAPSGGKP